MTEEVNKEVKEETPKIPSLEEEIAQLKQTVNLVLPRAIQGMDGGLRELSRQTDKCRQAIQEIKKDLVIMDIRISAIEGALAETDMFSGSINPTTRQRRRETGKQRWLNAITRICKEDYGVSYVDLRTGAGNPIVSDGVSTTVELGENKA